MVPLALPRQQSKHDCQRLRLFLTPGLKKAGSGDDVHCNVWDKPVLCVGIGNRHSGSSNQWCSHQKLKAFHEDRAQPWCNYFSGPWTKFALIYLSPPPLFQDIPMKRRTYHSRLVRVLWGVQLPGVSGVCKSLGFQVLWASCLSSGVMIEYVVGRWAKSKAIARSEKRMVSNVEDSFYFYFSNFESSTNGFIFYFIFFQNRNKCRRILCNGVKMSELEKFRYK